MATSHGRAGPSSKGLHNKFMILHLPEHIFQQALSYLSYHELSEARRVCQYFNRCCQDLLAQGFAKVDKYHSLIQKEIKSKLPRRESERRNHELSRHVDILSAIETRLSLLSMTYSKYIDHGLCCFIPGKVLDEIFTLLKKLHVSTSQPPRAHEFLQELRDISSMAMEHFEEHIIPGLKQQIPSGSLPLVLPDPFSPEHGSSSPPMMSFSSPIMTRIPSLRQEIMRLQHQVRIQSSGLQTYRKEVVEQKNKMAEQKKINLEQEKKLQEQSRLIADQNARIDRLENSVNDFNNKVEGIYALLQTTDKLDMDNTADSAVAPGPSQQRQGRWKRKRAEEDTDMTRIKSHLKRNMEADTCQQETKTGTAKTRGGKRRKN